MAFQILTDMPIPRSGRSRNGNNGKRGDKYKIAALEIGQCVLFDVGDEGFYRSQRGYLGHHAAAAASSHAKRFGKKFESRHLPDGRFGIWRIA